MLDYKDIIIKHYGLGMSGREIAIRQHKSKSGVNDFLKAFAKCEALGYPLPEGITNEGIAELVYQKNKPEASRDFQYELPDFNDVYQQMTSRKNMTLVFLWGRYKNSCVIDGKKFYSYRQFCDLYAKWCAGNAESLHLNAVIGQKIEVDFAGKTFTLVDRITGEASDIVVFVAVLPYSQYIYAEGMVSTKEPQWIDVNNNALRYFGGVTPIIVCDNCKQAVIANQDWIQPDLNKDYAEWAEHNHTVILPAKVRRPKFKSSVENAVGILEKGFFHDLEEHTYFKLEDFNEALWQKLIDLNEVNLKNRNYSRYERFLEEKEALLPLPSTAYHYMERRTAKVSSDFHVRFDNAYYSVPKQYVHKQVSIRATTLEVRIYAQTGEILRDGPRAKYKGEWLTDPEHLPKDYTGYAEWSGAYFIQRALAIGPATTDVIRRVLKSRAYEVQTYRQCIGILNFSKKYGRHTLESCCAQALNLGKVSYTFIKNSIPALAANTMTDAEKREANEQKNKGAFVMSSDASSIDSLLAKSRALANSKQGGGDAI